MISCTQLVATQHNSKHTVPRTFVLIWIHLPQLSQAQRVENSSALLADSPAILDPAEQVNSLHCPMGDSYWSGPEERRREHPSQTPYIGMVPWSSRRMQCCYLSPLLPHRNDNMYSATFWGPLACEAFNKVLLRGVKQNHRSEDTLIC